MALFVVYAPETGHVVGAVDALGSPALPPPDRSGIVSAEPLVGTALPLRVFLGDGHLSVLAVPARELAAHAADDQPGVLDDPLAFGVEQAGTGQPPKPALVPLWTWTEEPEELTGPDRPASSQESGQLKFTPVGLSVTIPTPDQVDDTQVVAFVGEAPNTRMTAGAIKAGETTVVLPIAVEDGTHGVLVLAKGWAGRLEAVKKP